MERKKAAHRKALLDAFTSEEIPEGKAIKTSKGYIYNIYAVRSSLDRTIYSTKDPQYAIDFIDDNPLSKDTSNAVIIDINSNKKYIIGYTRHTNSLIPAPGIKPLGVLARRQINFVSSIQIAKKLGLKESIFDGIWYFPNSNFIPSSKPMPYNKFPFPDINMSSKKDLLKYGIISPTYSIAEGKRYSMGIELESSGGRIPLYIRKNLNIECVYDGSIRDDEGRKGVGGEFVSGVLRGDNGFRHLYKITTELSKRCSLNKTCSVHVHLGGLKFTKSEVIMLWKINQLLESELYSTMPRSRLSREHCKPMKQVAFNFKQKNKPLSVIIDQYYTKLFKIVSLGKAPSRTVNKKFGHPAGHSCGYDTSTPRYWWINFVPTMFNLKGEENYTIEYRMMSASLNFTKIKAWILICMGITYVAENHQKFVMDAKKITLEEVMKLAYPSKWKYLVDYIEERKVAFNLSYSKHRLNEKAEYIVNRESLDTNKTLRDTIWD